MSLALFASTRALKYTSLRALRNVHHYSTTAPSESTPTEAPPNLRQPVHTKTPINDSEFVKAHLAHFGPWEKATYMNKVSEAYEAAYKTKGAEPNTLGKWGAGFRLVMGGVAVFLVIDFVYDIYIWSKDTPEQRQKRRDESRAKAEKIMNELVAKRKQARDEKEGQKKKDAENDKDTPA